MVDPVIALLIFAAVALTAAVVLWPRIGVLARLGRLGGRDARVQLEDAIKHCYTAESGGRAATLESLAGALEIPRDAAA
ncbi:MAG TPA: hypothetical protein VFX50_18215, partial [Gemmatimonadales bacterium]|nr:hypothetical protein [Gemmatimonadales bacterium]